MSDKPIRRTEADTLKRLRQMHWNELHNTHVSDHHLVTLDEDTMELRVDTDVFRALRVVGTDDYAILLTNLWDDRLFEYC
jgi:hypothetical protein